jgi:hypothetical protein
MARGHQSEGENVSEIQALTLRTQSLSHAVDFWNLLMLWGLALAALAAVFVVIATRIVVTRTGQLTDAQDLLSDAKDRQNTADSKEKDKKIADALQQAAESNKAAGLANERAGNAEERAAEANRVAEGEKLARIKIEERMGGWKLPKDAQERVSEALKPFAGTHFSLAANPVENPFVETIDRILGESGWIREAPLDDEGKPATVLLAGKAMVAFSSGLSVVVSEDQFVALSPAAAAYKQALIAEGLDVKLLKALPPASKPAPTVVKINIGKRE